MRSCGCQYPIWHSFFQSTCSKRKVVFKSCWLLLQQICFCGGWMVGDYINQAIPTCCVSGSSANKSTAPLEMNLGLCGEEGTGGRTPLHSLAEQQFWWKCWRAPDSFTLRRRLSQTLLSMPVNTHLPWTSRNVAWKCRKSLSIGTNWSFRVFSLERRGTHTGETWIMAGRTQTIIIYFKTSLEKKTWTCIFWMDFFAHATLNGYTQDARVWVGFFNFTIFHEAQKPKLK